MEEGDTLHTNDGRPLGRVERLDQPSRIVEIKKRVAAADCHPAAAFAHSVVPTNVLASSIMRLASWVVEHELDGDGQYRAARDLLLGRRPRLLGDRGGSLEFSSETTFEAAKRLVGELDNSVLAIQGPPGSGKTYMGSCGMRPHLALVVIN